MLRSRLMGRFGLIVLVGLLLGGCFHASSTRAVIQLSATRGTVPLTVHYDASGSEGKDGITTYRWTVGGETEIYGVSGSHTFNHAGDYDVELTVRAADGSVATESTLIEVEPAFWVADENLGEIYKLDISGNVIQTLPSPATQPRGLAAVERNGTWSLFVSCMGSGFQQLLEIDMATGAVLQHHSAPAQSPGGLTYAPVAPFRLWHVDGLSRKIYEINPSDGITLNVFGATYFQASPHLIDSVFLQTPGGIAWKSGSGTAGALWVLESETHLLYELEIVPAVNIFASTQLALQPDPIALTSSLFPIAGFDWNGDMLWVVQRDQHQIVQVDPATGTPTGILLNSFPGAAVSGLSIQK
ncbi:PKD domain-containing protein [Candidatus Bipolaricaulota bacterium]|nr:PKD domain-containing protein [Candidatus Bipolaricaulota bacterium]